MINFFILDIYVDSSHGFEYLVLSLRYFTIFEHETFLSTFDPQVHMSIKRLTYLQCDLLIYRCA